MVRTFLCFVPECFYSGCGVTGGHRVFHLGTIVVILQLEVRVSVQSRIAHCLSRLVMMQIS